MSETNTAPATNHAMPTWRRVSELADLVEIFDPDVQVCSWPRDVDPAIETFLSGWQPMQAVQRIETLVTPAKPTLDSLPAASGREALIADLALLGDIMSELLGCPEVGMRFARVEHAMCPGWHVDRTSIRLVCTYQGPGTQWLDDQTADRRDLCSGESKASRFIQATPGEIVLLKGFLWQENSAFGAIHRSPDIAPTAPLRTLVTVDPLWRD